MSPPTKNDANNPEPFPAFDVGRVPLESTHNEQTPTRSAPSSSFGNRIRRVSQSFSQSEIPEGFSAATSDIASSIFTQKASARSRNTSAVDGTGGNAAQAVTGNATRHDTGKASDGLNPPTSPVQQQEDIARPRNGEPADAAPFENGYHFPPRHSFVQSTALGLRGFWNYFLTPLGFAVTIYGLNVVAWGGMLFLLLCNAAPAMCHPSCNDINSARRKWIEWDSQILNALFCVTGFGLAPWRFRDLYYLMQYRMFKNAVALRRLAGIHRGWFRLPGSADVPAHINAENVTQYSAHEASIPYPETKIPTPPLTGKRASPTRLWKLDLVIWLMVWNTLFQCCLSGFMWGMNRHNRPSWSTGLFVALACIVAAAGGFVMFLEGKRVKGIEGVPVSDRDLQRLRDDRENGIWHFNNLKGKKPASSPSPSATRSDEEKLNKS